MSPFTRPAPALLLLALAFAPGSALGQEQAGDLVPVTPTAQLRVTQFGNYFGYGNTAHVTPDGKTVVSCQGNFFYLYDLTKPFNPQRPQQPKQITLGNVYFNNNAVALLPDGETVVGLAQGNVYDDAAVRFWNLNTGKEVRLIENDFQFNGLAASPDGKRLALGTQQKIEIWDAETGEEVRILQAGADPNNYYRLMAFSPDGRMLAGVGMGNTVHVWEVATGKERAKVQLGTDPVHPNLRYRGGMQFGVHALEFSRDGRLLAIGAQDNSVHLWNVATGEELPPLSGHTGPVVGLGFLKNGKNLVTFDGSGLKLTWSVARLSRPTTAKLPHLPDEEFADLWNDLGEGDGFRTYRAIRHLSADPKRAVALLEKQLKPVPAGDAARIAQLVTDLQSPNAGTRRKAMTEMKKHGEAGLGALLALPQNQQQSHRSIQILIGRMEAEEGSAERQRSVKAVEVLERIGDGEAKALLEKLSKGAPGARLTVKAKAALERLNNPAERAVPADGKAEDLWADLAADDAVKAFRAVRGLIASPKSTVPMLRERLKPMPPVDPKQTEQLIADLDHAEYAVREKATVELEKLGELAEPALRKMLAGGPGLEARKRAERLLEKLSPGGTPPAATLRLMRAMEALERIDTDDATELLHALAAGAPEAWLTRDAKAALERRPVRTATR